MTIASLTQLIESSDLDGLVHLIDGAASGRAWDELVEVRHRCAAAVERGKQVWAARAYAAYRLALEAPAEYAAAVVAEGDDRHTLGPLWEVAASTHTWAELEPHLPPGPERVLAAHERVLRGEDLRSAGITDDVLELPLLMEEWEPAYPLATYRPDRVDSPPPSLPAPAQPIPRSGDRAAEDEGTEALYELVRPWAEESNGAVAVASTAGGAAAGVLGAVVIVDLAAPEAMAWGAWAGASGGAHGRRRGGAVGRFNMWWALAAMAGMDWPVDTAPLGKAVAEMSFSRFAPAELAPGWEFHLAVGHGGRGWAVAATDAEDPVGGQPKGR